ncbi:MAG: hypothetical protein V4773_25820 [Verrucomicrobiota bacterium]
MTENDRKLLRLVILRELRLKGDLGVTEPRLHDAVRMHGHDLSLPVLQAELRDVENLNWISSFTPELGAKRWCISPLGEMKYVQSGA